MKVRKLFLSSILLSLTLLSCTSCKSGGKPASSSEGSDPGKSRQESFELGKRFSSDSAFLYVADQVEFGPRVPGSEAHRNCGEYIKSQLTRFGVDTIIVQTATLTAYNGDQIPMENILGQFNSRENDRILLVAHYDTRPWADMDAETSRRRNPIPGANDGGSGVGVLLEIARQLGRQNPSIGVDLLFVDAEDYGCSDGWERHDESWAMGSRHFAHNLPYTSITKPRYGIVLDMVGGTDARFHREYFSEKYAPGLLDKVWLLAQDLGYSSTFINHLGGSIIDDHIPLSQAGIPTIDIVECNNVTTGHFPPTWHTHQDNMDNITRTSLKKVGDVVLTLIYSATPLDSSIKNPNIQ